MSLPCPDVPGGTQEGSGGAADPSSASARQLQLVLQKATLFSDMLKSEIAESLREAAARQQAAEHRAAAASSATGEIEESHPGHPSEEADGAADPSMPLLGDHESQLLPHQRFGRAWLLAMFRCGCNAILADEMGLGKTIQVIAFVASLADSGVVGPHLIVAPVGTLPNWAAEFARWCPSMPVYVHHGTPRQRAQTKAIVARRCARQRSAITPATMSEEELLLSEPLLPPARPSWGGDPAAPPMVSDPHRDVARRGGVMITSFETLLADQEDLMGPNFSFSTLIVDEAHRLKNFECKLIQALRTMHSVEMRILLTGTPLQNNLRELWSILNFVVPDVFDRLSTFEEWFRLQLFEEQQKETEKPTPDEEDADDAATARENLAATLSHTDQQVRLICSIHRVLRPFMLRRTKADVPSLKLPPKVEIILRCPLTAAQRALYDSLLSDSALWNQGRIMQLRKACGHLHLFPSHNPCLKAVKQNGGSSFWPNNPQKEAAYVAALVNGSGKMRLLHRLLPILRAQGRRVLLFSQFTSVLDIIEDYLMHMRGGVPASSLTGPGSDGRDGEPAALFYPYERLDGTVKLSDRQVSIQRFSEHEEDFDRLPFDNVERHKRERAGAATQPASSSAAFLFLISTRAGGVGLNLIAADTVIIFDSDFNPQVDLQAIDRCHRIGQSKPVVVYRFFTPASIEEAVRRINLGKLRLERLVIGEGQLDAGAVEAKEETDATVAEDAAVKAVMGAEERMRAALRDAFGMTMGHIDTTPATVPSRSSSSLCAPRTKLVRQRKTKAELPVIHEISDAELKELTDRSEKLFARGSIGNGSI